MAEYSALDLKRSAFGMADLVHNTPDLLRRPLDFYARPIALTQPSLLSQVSSSLLAAQQPAPMQFAELQETYQQTYDSYQRALDGISTATSVASQVAQAIEPLRIESPVSGLAGQYDISGIANSLSTVNSVADAYRSVVEASQAVFNWKPGLMRWAQPPISEMFDPPVTEWARVISEATQSMVMSVVSQAIQDLKKPSLIYPSALRVPSSIYPSALRAPSSSMSLEYEPIDIVPLWPSDGPDIPEELVPEQEFPEAGDDAPSGPEVVSRPEFVVLKQDLDALKREVARQRRPFLVRLGEKVVVGLLVKVIWSYTPLGDYAGVVVDQIQVLVEGVYYTLPYVPF